MDAQASPSLERRAPDSGSGSGGRPLFRARRGQDRKVYEISASAVARAPSTECCPGFMTSNLRLRLLLAAAKDRRHRRGVHDSEIPVAVVEDHERAHDAAFLQVSRALPSD